MYSLPRRASLLLAAVCLVAPACFAQVPRSNHVYIVAEENTSYEHMVGNTADMPYLNSLIAKGGLATQFYADQHSSLPDYFWVTAGQYITNDNTTTSTFDVDNIVRHVLASGETFKSYAQSLPYPGFTGLYSGAYLKRHAPLIYFTDVAGSLLVLNHVDTNQMASDIASGNLPNFAFITPDALHDIHDCPNGLAACMQTADQWLRQNIGPLLARPEFQPGGDGLLIIWADEADLNTDNRCSATVLQGCGGRILVALIGPQVKSGYQSAITYHHENVLRTMLEALGTTANFPGAAQNASDMADFFQGPPSTPTTRQVTIQSPMPGASVTSPLQIVANAVSDTPIMAITAYVDNVSVGTVAASQISTPVAVAPGAHRVVVNAWDSHGNLMQNSADLMAVAPVYGVSIDSPNDGGTTGSYMHVSAAAMSAAPVTALTVYVDNTALLTASGSHVDAYLPVAAGSHHMVINAWDTAGNVYSKGISVTAAASAANGVTISAPAANALTGNSVRVQASASSNNLLPIVAMTVYVDGQSVYTGSGSVDTNVSLSNGAHTIGVNAWDSSGAVFVSNINVRASAGAAYQVSIAMPATAASGTAVNILVNASSSAPVSATALYVDNQLAWMGYSSQLNVSGVMPNGTHSVVAQAWDATGAVYKTITSITVQ